MSNKYVLHNAEEAELRRLKFQHEVWKEQTVLGIEKAGFSSGDTIVDLGCGPGYLSQDLSKVVGSNGRIVAVDNSKKFIDHLKHETARLGISNIHTINCNVEELSLENESADGAVARWLFMFIKNPEKIIRIISRSLKRGASFLILDYFQFRSMSLWPPDKYFTKIYHSVYELIKSYGGNADAGGLMPELLERNGFEITDIIPVLRTGRPGTQMWQWLEMTSRNHINLVENNLITNEDLESYYKIWNERTLLPASFFSAPPLMITIGRKL